MNANIQYRYQANNDQTTTTMAYYRHPDYCSESEMKKQGWSEDEKAEQRERNWDIRLDHYAKNSHVLKNCVQFRKMVDDWAESFQFPSPGVPTMKMLRILKLSRENGILSETLTEFNFAEKELLHNNPNFVSPAAAVKFNTEKHHQLCLASIKARAEKRERNVASILIKKLGRDAAKEYRASVKAAWEESVSKGHEQVEAKIAEARKNDASEDAISVMKKKLVHDMMFDLYIDRVNASSASKFK
jgi:hypothetical protein